MRNFINIISEAVAEDIPETLRNLGHEIRGKSWETAKRIVVSKVGSIGRGEKFTDDVADAIFLRIQRNSQVGRYGDEETIQKLGQNARRLEGNHPITLYRAAPRGSGIRPGDFCTSDRHEAGNYLHGGHVIHTLTVPSHDVIGIEGSIGGGQELIYLPLDYVEPEAREFYSSFREFYNSMNSRLDEIAGVRQDMADFSKDFDDPRIITRVQAQAARKNPAWKKTLITMMSRHGFELVGAGINGAVFRNPQYPYVLKVYRKDRGYDEWVHFMRTNRGNKYVPKLKGNVIRLNSVFSAIRVETLVPCPVDLANQFIDQTWNIADGLWKRDVDQSQVDPDLIKIAQFMRDWEGHTDLTSHNIMARSDGQIVIIDPLNIDESLND